MTWNLHLVGHDLTDDFESAVSDFTKALSAIGHVVDSVVLTTDQGQKIINPVIAEAADVVKTVVPEAAPVVDTVEKVVDTAATDSESSGGLLKAVENEAENIVHDLTGKTTPTPTPPTPPTPPATYKATS